MRYGVDSEPERFQTTQVLTISVTHNVHDIYTAFLPPLLPEFIANLSLSKTEAGLLNVFLLVPSLLQPLIGHQADRASLRYVVILAPTVTAVMMSLLGVAPGYGMLALFLTVAGLSSAGFHAIGPAMVGQLSGRRLGRGMGFWMVGGELGRVLGPVVIVAAVELLTLGGTPWLMVLGPLASVMLYIRLRGAPERLPNADPEGQSIPWRRALQGMWPLLGPLTGIVAARAFMLSALTTYLPIFLTEEGANLWTAGASLSLLEAAGVVGALVGGSLSDRLGRRLVLFISMLATPLLMFIFLATRGPAQLPVLLALGLTALSIAPVLLALVQESFPENRALANGVYLSMSFVIRSGALVALGVFSDLFGMRMAFAASAVIPLLGLPLVLLLPGRDSQSGKG